MSKGKTSFLTMATMMSIAAGSSFPVLFGGPPEPTHKRTRDQRTEDRAIAAAQAKRERKEAKRRST